MKTTNLSATSISELKLILQEQINDDFKPTLAFVFSSPELPYHELPTLFTSFGITLIGCTTTGEIFNEAIHKNSFSVLLFDLQASYFHTFQKEYGTEGVYATAVDLGKAAVQKFANPGIILYSGGITIDGDQLVNGIKHGTEKPIPIYGGLAADGTRFETTYCFGKDMVSSMGLVALIVDADKITLNGLSYSGWDSLGATHKITRAVGNTVYEINNKPALDEFEKYFGQLRYGFTAESEKEFEVIVGQFPLKILKQEGVSILRSVLVNDQEQKSLVLAGGVQEGDSFKFCNTPNFDVVDNTIEHFGKLKEQIGQVDAIIMNSCAGRLSVFGPMLEDEIEMIYNYWDKPMVGYFAYGEIGNTNLDNNNCEFHNVTCSIVTLTEKK